MKEESWEAQKGFCVKCGKKVNIKNPKVKESDSTTSVSGTCPNCGTPVHSHSKKESESHWTHELQKHEAPELNPAHTSFNQGEHTQDLMTWDEYMEHVKKEHAEEYKKLLDAMPPSMRISPQLPQMVTPNAGYNPQAAWDEITFVAKEMDLYRCEFCGKEVHFEASADFSATGLVEGELLEFEKENANHWLLDRRDADEYVNQINNGVLLSDSHGKTLRDICGKATEAQKVVENGKTKLRVKARIDDEDIDNLVENNKDKIGMSIEGNSSDMFCNTCGKRLQSIYDKCDNHPEAPMRVRHLKIRKISLTDSPAYPNSKISSYQKLD